MFLGLKRSTTSSPFVESLQLLPEQIRGVFRDAKSLKSNIKANDINLIVVNGMGGSNLGAEIIKSVFRDELKLPLVIEPGYDVPAYVNKKTLYIISSYSGTTEEPLAAYAAAKRKGAKLFVVTSQGNNKLATIARKNNLSHYLFSTEKNPSNQPRLGLGLSIASLLLLFKTLGTLSIKDKEIESVIKQLKRQTTKLTGSGSAARMLAKKMSGREAILVGGQFIEGNLKALRNQWCENAKNYASYLVLSDMNHFALEGLTKPSSNRKRLAAIFFESSLYDKRIAKRMALTKEVMRKQGIPVHTYHLIGKTPLEQGFDMLQFGSWLTYYLSVKNRVNPSEIKWVDWFKKNLTN